MYTHDSSSSESSKETAEAAASNATATAKGCIVSNSVAVVKFRLAAAVGCSEKQDMPQLQADCLQLQVIHRHALGARGYGTTAALKIIHRCAQTLMQQLFLLRQHSSLQSCSSAESIM